MIQLDRCVKFFSKFQFPANYWFAGGAVRDFFLGVPIVDYDVFFPSDDDFNKTKDFLLNDKGKIIWESGNGVKIIHKNIKFDLVKKIFKDPQDCINQFDFTVSMFAVDTKVYYGESSFIDLAKRQLMINALPLPVSTFYRAFRYYNKGFKMCQEEMFKLVLALKDADIVQTKQNISGHFTGID
jgi:hypothetical protein